MCIAIAAKIIEIDENTGSAKALFMGNIINVNTRLVSVSVGDHVLVHAGCAIEVVTQTFAEETVDLLKELERFHDDD